MPGKKTYIANIFIPLLLGTVIYFVFRPDTYISIYLSQAFHSIGWNMQSVYGSGNPAAAFLQNFGCDILWAYALVFAVHYFAAKPDNHANPAQSLVPVFVLCLIFDIIIEILQYMSIISGTFDVMDVIVEVAATFAAVGVIYNICKGDKHYEEELDS